MQDIVPVLQWVSGFIVSAGGVWLLTQLVKKANSLPFIHEGQTPRIRALAAVLSAVAVVVMNLAGKGELDVSSVSDLLLKVLEVGIVWGGAHSIHASTKQVP